MFVADRHNPLLNYSWEDTPLQIHPGQAFPSLMKNYQLIYDYDTFQRVLSFFKSYGGQLLSKPREFVKDSDKINECLQKVINKVNSLSTFLNSLAPVDQLNREEIQKISIEITTKEKKLNLATQALFKSISTLRTSVTNKLDTIQPQQQSDGCWLWRSYKISDQTLTELSPVFSALNQMWDSCLDYPAKEIYELNEAIQTRKAEEKQRKAALLQEKKLKIASDTEAILRQGQEEKQRIVAKFEEKCGKIVKNGY